MKLFAFALVFLTVSAAQASWEKGRLVPVDYKVQLDEAHQLGLWLAGDFRIVGQYFKRNAFGSRVSTQFPNVCVTKVEKINFSEDRQTLEERVVLNVSLTSDLQKELAFKNVDHLVVEMEITTVFPTMSANHYVRVFAANKSETSGVQLSSDWVYLDETNHHPMLPPLGKEGKYFAQKALQCQK